MEPALAQFESKYAKKINFVSVDLDDTKNPINLKYARFYGKDASPPLTLWVDAHGKVLDRAQARLSAAELAKRTDRLLNSKR